MSEYQRGFEDGLREARHVILDLEAAYKKTAKTLRAERKGWFFRGPSHESIMSARLVETAAHGLATIRRVLAMRAAAPSWTDWPADEKKCEEEAA